MHKRLFHAKIQTETVAYYALFARFIRSVMQNQTACASPGDAPQSVVYQLFVKQRFYE